jgi:hypothetical protein
MKNDWRLTALYILIGVIFAVTPFVKTLANPLLWLTALIFLGLGVYRLVKSVKK